MLVIHGTWAYGVLSLWAEDSGRPVLHPARDVDRLPAGCGERLRGPRGASSRPADHVDRLVLRYLRGAGAELTEGDVPGSRRVARCPLLVFAHVKQPRTFWDAGRRNLLNLLARCTPLWHSRSAPPAIGRHMSATIGY
jgi:hypothetical protein